MISIHKEARGPKRLVTPVLDYDAAVCRRAGFQLVYLYIFLDNILFFMTTNRPGFRLRYRVCISSSSKSSAECSRYSRSHIAKLISFEQGKTIAHFESIMSKDCNTIFQWSTLSLFISKVTNLFRHGLLFEYSSWRGKQINTISNSVLKQQ